MLRFRLRQLLVPSLQRFFLPLPKMGAGQLALLSGHLEGRGFSVRPAGGEGRLSATRASQRISIDGRLGLASSAGDLLDAIAPAVPALVASAKGSADGGADRSGRYYSLRGSGSSPVLQFLPRLESMRTWSALRAEGLCALTPDEALALGHVLGKLPAHSRVECVTSSPREGSRPLQVGRRVLYRSELRVGEFLSSLRSIDSAGAGPVSYLPRDARLRLDGGVPTSPLPRSELGEWCLV